MIKGLLIEKKFADRLVWDESIEDYEAMANQCKYENGYDMQCVFKYENELYMFEYETSSDGEIFYHNDDKIKCVQVKPVEMTITVYEPLEKSEDEYAEEELLDELLDEEE